MSLISSFTDLPKIIASPSVISIIPVSIEIKVVFPAPLWPNKTLIYPLYKVKLKLLTAYFPVEYFLLIFFNSIV